MNNLIYIPRHLGNRVYFSTSNKKYLDEVTRPIKNIASYSP